VFDNGLFADGQSPVSINLDCLLALPKSTGKVDKVAQAALKAQAKADKAAARVEAQAAKAAERKAKADEALAKAKARLEQAQGTPATS